MEDVAVVDPESILILPPSPSSPVLTVMCMLPPVPDFGVHGRGFPMVASPLEILMLPETPSYVGAVDVAVIKPVRRVAAVVDLESILILPPSRQLSPLSSSRFNDAAAAKLERPNDCRRCRR